MSIIFQNIKDFFYNLNGVLLPKDRVLDEDLNDIYFQVFCVEDRLEPHNDRINIRRDIFNVRRDFRKSIKEYKEQHNIEESING